MMPATLLIPSLLLAALEEVVQAMEPDQRPNSSHDLEKGVSDAAGALVLCCGLASDSMALIESVERLLDGIGNKPAREIRAQLGEVRAEIMAAGLPGIQQQRARGTPVIALPALGEAQIAISGPIDPGQMAAAGPKMFAALWGARKWMGRIQPVAERLMPYHIASGMVADAMEIAMDAAITGAGEKARVAAEAHHDRVHDQI